jgi:uncharacterized protein YukE
MTDVTNIDSEKILSAVSQLDGIVDRMNGCEGKFADAIENLDKGWVSEVKGPFMANYQTDWEAMQEMLSQLRELGVTLREAAADFDKTESEMLGGVNALG